MGLVDDLEKNGMTNYSDKFRGLKDNVKKLFDELKADVDALKETHGDAADRIEKEIVKDVAIVYDNLNNLEGTYICGFESTPDSTNAKKAVHHLMAYVPIGTIVNMTHCVSYFMSKKEQGVVDDTVLIEQLVDLALDIEDGKVNSEKSLLDVVMGDTYFEHIQRLSVYNEEISSSLGTPAIVASG